MINPVEEVLNWQTENSLAHNRHLLNIRNDIQVVKKDVQEQGAQLVELNKKIAALTRQYENMKYVTPEPGMSYREFQTQMMKEKSSLTNMINNLKTQAERFKETPISSPISSFSTEPLYPPHHGRLEPHPFSWSTTLEQNTSKKKAYIPSPGEPPMSNYAEWIVFKKKEYETEQRYKKQEAQRKEKEQKEAEEARKKKEKEKEASTSSQNMMKLENQVHVNSLSSYLKTLTCQEKEPVIAMAKEESEAETEDEENTEEDTATEEISDDDEQKILMTEPIVTMAEEEEPTEAVLDGEGPSSQNPKINKNEDEKEVSIGSETKGSLGQSLLSHSRD